MTRFFGRYRRSNPLRYSLLPRSQLGKWPCKVSSTVELLINQTMHRKFFPVVISFDSWQRRLQQLGYLSLIVSSFYEFVNLISFSLAEVFVFHKQLRQLSQKDLNAIHPQPAKHQLIKVALRA